MASEEIILFDLTSKPPVESWSLNPWKSQHDLLPMLSHLQSTHYF